MPRSTRTISCCVRSTTTAQRCWPGASTRSSPVSTWNSTVALARGCVVEAHGDLRPEHILLSEPPAVIDCLEFDRNLRILDRAEELCFLELECARLGHAPVGRWLLEECLRRLSDDASRTLLDYYRGHRSATRAKLYTWRVDEPDGGTPEEWRARAAQYLAIALDATTEAPRSR